MCKIHVDIRVKCIYCNAFTKTVSPVVIEKVLGKQSRPRYLLEGVCAVCNKKKNKTLNEPQTKLLPPEILDAKYGSVFASSITRNGEALPLLPLIGAILEGTVDKPKADADSQELRAPETVIGGKLSPDATEDVDNAKQLTDDALLLTDSEARACPAEMQCLEQRAVCFLESKGYTVTRNDELLLKSMQRLQGYGFVLAL